MDQHLTTPPTQVSNMRTHAGNQPQPINPILCSCNVPPGSYKAHPGPDVVAQLLFTLQWVMLPSHLSYKVTSGLFAFLHFKFCSFSCARSFSFLPRCSPSSSRLHGPSSPRLQSSPNARQIHGSLHPQSPSFPRTSPQLPALRSLWQNYTPASSLHFSLPKSSGTLDRAPSVRSNYFLCIIKRLRANLALCRLCHFGSVLWSIKFLARFLEHHNRITKPT